MKVKLSLIFLCVQLEENLKKGQIHEAPKATILDFKKFKNSTMVKTM